MQERFDAMLGTATAAIAAAEDERALRDLEVKYLGKKGEVTALMAGMRDVAPADRPAFGQKVNALRDEVTAAIQARRGALEEAELARLCEDPTFDATLPVAAFGGSPRVGALHPLTVVSRHIEDVFRAMGFLILDYPEVETEFFNFTGLNIPPEHPARDMQDTFWLNDGNLLRTHTSTGQVRAMREYGAPLRAIFPGRVFRYESVDASHEHTFHQCEGLMVDKSVSVAQLIHSMKTLLSSIFERDVTIRLRPGYFPFVEPGFELDIQCQVCGGRGCSVCKHSGWVELLPCGLVHPNVLRHGGLDPNEWEGWAFGLGLSRLVMMKYQIEDIRHLLGGDLRFLAQFRQG
ncbi:MAG: phenylalanine--tRNA ligase subunit alpha [Myxococcales bacterium]|nr:phenylalanine--tRNA ligase subunit alpha [Myxococcales bacterium]MCB9734410.1 phenylalanine--tRNA ligase subunit alpha [Deltaproteobacteria bacterium]